MNQWTTVKICSSRIEAEIVAQFLKANGISAHIKSDDMGGLRPNLSLTMGVAVQVSSQQVDEAIKLLAENN